MSDKKILMTGATGYIADQLLPSFREAYDMVLVDVTERNRQGNRVAGVVIADLIDPDRSRYAKLFDGVDAVVHLAYKRRTGNRTRPERLHQFGLDEGGQRHRHSRSA